MMLLFSLNLGMAWGPTSTPPSPVTTEFTYVSVDHVSPSRGSYVGGTPVVIRGSGFSYATGGVTFGGAAATNVSIVSNTRITCTTPAHASGTVDVTVAGVD